MMRERVTRLANPRRKRRTTRNASGQFVKRKKKANTRRRAKANPKKRRTVKRTATKRRRTKRRNPAFLVTLGTVNPRRKRRNSRVAKKTRRKSVRRRRRVARTSNPPVRRRRRRRAVAAAPVRRRRRRANPVRRRRRNYGMRRRRNGYSRRRRNPSIGGSLSLAEKGVGVLLGVTAAKLIPTFIPAQFITSPIMRILATGASAYIASMVASKVRPGLADAVLWGGFAQTVSVALNVYLPSVGSQIGLSGFRRGMGDLVDGHFVVPQNPINYLPPPGPVAPRVEMSGIARSFGNAW